MQYKCLGVRLKFFTIHVCQAKIVVQSRKVLGKTYFSFGCSVQALSSYCDDCDNSSTLYLMCLSCRVCVHQSLPRTAHHSNMADCVWLCRCATDGHQHHQTLLQEQKQWGWREKLRLHDLELLWNLSLLLPPRLDHSWQLLGVWVLRFVATVQRSSRSKLLLPPGPLLVFLRHTGRDLCHKLHLLLHLLLCILSHRLCCSSCRLAGECAD